MNHTDWEKLKEDIDNLGCGFLGVIFIVTFLVVGLCLFGIIR